MSKSNMLLGFAQGKFGDIVFYRAGGEQRHRPLVVPKNPRSAAQMGQRVRLANVPAFYRVLQPILKESFSNRPSKQSGYNAFAKGAIEKSPFLTKSMALRGSVLPAPYMVSRGVIPSVPFVMSADGAPIGASLLTDERIEPTTTIGAVSEGILRFYPYLQQGDILTIVNVVFKVDESTDDIDSYYAVPYVDTFTIDTTSTELVSSTSLKTDTFNLAFTLPVGTENIAGAIIVSRVLADGTLQTSTASLLLDEVAASLYDNYRTEQALSDAIDSYGRGQESILR